VDRASLRVLPGGSAVVDAAVSSDPVGFQSRCVDDYWASCTVRGSSSVTIENDAAGVLDRILALLGLPAWEATAEDVDRVVGGLAADGLASSTRRVCAGVQGVSPVPAVPQGGRVRRVVRRAVGLPGG